MTDVLILCYHAIADEWPSELAVTPTRLRQQLISLLERGYRPTTFTRAVTAPPAGKVFSVTFDDGYRSVGERGFPVLSELGVPGTVFVCTDFVPTGRPMPVGVDRWRRTPYEKELIGMSWPALAELRSAGWEVGSHTRSHARLTEVDDERLRAELGDSKSECEQRLQAPCTSIAYPKGAVDGRVAAAGHEAGYEAGGALLGRRKAPDPLRVPRLSVYRSDTARRFRVKTSTASRRIRSSAVWDAVSPLYLATGGGRYRRGS